MSTTIQEEIHKRQIRKIILAIFFGSIIIIASAVTVLLVFNHPDNNQRQHVVVPPPINYQSGILVNNVNQTFPFDYEWPVRLARDTNYTVRIILLHGVGVDAIWARIDDGSNLLQPWLNSGTLNSTNSEVTWSGQISVSSPYKLELGNVADERNMATVQVYIADT